MGKETKKMGELHGKNTMFLSIHVGSGTVKINNKKLDFNMSVGATNYAPIVEYGCRKFTLSWEDILKLAEDKGLFNDNEGESK